MYRMAISSARSALSSTKVHPATSGGGGSAPFTSRYSSRYSPISRSTSSHGFCGTMRRPTPSLAMMRDDSGDTAAA